jgi:hypothetical protein
MKLARGRAFGGQDQFGSSPVAVVNEALARMFFGGAEAALGKRLVLHKGAGVVEVVGIVGDARPVYLKREPRPFVYLPVTQSRRFLGSLQVRADDSISDLSPLAERIRRVVRESHPGLRVLSLRTVREDAERMLSQEKLLATLSTSFGLVALFLVCVGLYGVISQWAGQRTGEIGLRMALGATQAGVRWLVLRQAFALVAIGVAVGLPAAMAGARLLGGMLFGLSPMDPATLTVASLVLFGVALLAAYLPARRAARIDPMVALRCE